MFNCVSLKITQRLFELKSRGNQSGINLQRGLVLSPGAPDATGKYPYIKRTVSQIEISHHVGLCVSPFTACDLLPRQTLCQLQVTTRGLS